MRITPTIGTVSGTLGGVIANRTRHGPRLSARAARVNPATIYQTAHRNRFGSIAGAWRALGASGQAVYNALAGAFPWKDRLGQAVTLSGYALFATGKITVYTYTTSQPPAPGTLTISVDGVPVAQIPAGQIAVDGTTVAEAPQ
jgi:hypothetical protein